MSGVSLASMGPEYTRSAVQASNFGSLDALAHYMVVECPDLMEATDEKLANATGLSVPVVKALKLDSEFRSYLDRLMTLDVMDYKTRRRQIEGLVNLSEKGESENARLQAFEIASRQAGMRVPERHEIDDNKTIEVRVRTIPPKRGGFVPEDEFRPPVSRREKLGEKTEEVREVEGRESVSGVRGLRGRSPALTVGGDE